MSFPEPNRKKIQSAGKEGGAHNTWCKRNAPRCHVGAQCKPLAVRDQSRLVAVLAHPMRRATFVYPPSTSTSLRSTAPLPRRSPAVSKLHVPCAANMPFTLQLTSSRVTHTTMPCSCCASAATSRRTGYSHLLCNIVICSSRSNRSIYSPPPPPFPVLCDPTFSTSPT